MALKSRHLEAVRATCHSEPRLCVHAADQRISLAYFVYPNRHHKIQGHNKKFPVTTFDEMLAQVHTNIIIWALTRKKHMQVDLFQC